MGRTQIKQAGFNIVELLVIVVAVGIIGAGGWFVYQHNRTRVTNAEAGGTPSSSQQNTQQQSTTPAPTVSYLSITEWGIKLPLSSEISDAYYVVPTNISKNPDGKPSGLYLDVASLKSSCGDISAGDTSRSVEKATGSITRVLPTDTDPSGRPYPQAYPNGVTIGGYYYFYTSRTSGMTCAPAATLQSIDSAFANAAKGAILVTAN